MLVIISIFASVVATLIALAVVRLTGLDLNHMYWMGPFFTITYLMFFPAFKRYFTRV